MKKNSIIVKLVVLAVSVIAAITLIINTMARFQSEVESIRRN